METVTNERRHYDGNKKIHQEFSVCQVEDYSFVNSSFSVKISIPLENTGVSSVFATSVWPFSLIFSLARRNEGNFYNIDKIEKELEKAREKAAEWQAKIRDLEKQKQEEENSQIVQAVRSLKLTPAELMNFCLFSTVCQRYASKVPSVT